MPKAAATLPNHPLLIDIYDELQTACEDLSVGLLLANSLCGEIDELPCDGAGRMLPELSVQLGWVLSRAQADCTALAQVKQRLRQLMTALAALPASPGN